MSENDIRENDEAISKGEQGGPVDEEDMQAAEGLAAPPETAKNYEDMLERGASQQGEGRVP